MMKTFDSEKVKTLLRELVATPSVNPSCLKDPSMKTLTCEKSVSEYVVAWLHPKEYPARSWSR
jgi:acetylornithine deacetylase/succinyl-diaminopimelate desuccinylase-like protein